MTRLLVAATLVALIAILAYALSGLVGGARAEAVPFAWSIFTSSDVDGSRLFLQSNGSVAADEVRLLSPDGSVVASAPSSSSAPGWIGCMQIQPGSARAAVPLSRSDLGRFQPSWPSGYRVEARVGGTWRPVQLTFAGCSSIE